MGPIIKANSTLLFKIEVVDIVPSTANRANEKKFEDLKEQKKGAETKDSKIDISAYKLEDSKDKPAKVPKKSYMETNFAATNAALIVLYETFFN